MSELAKDDRSDGFLSWQLRNYPDNHTARANLLLHVVTVPLFHVGTVVMVAGWIASPFVSLGGLGAMLFVAIAQGRGHKLERVPPIPFRGPHDAIARLFIEQWVTFPRFVFSGGLGRALHHQPPPTPPS